MAHLLQTRSSVDFRLSLQMKFVTHPKVHSPIMSKKNAWTKLPHREKKKIDFKFLYSIPRKIKLLHV